MNLHKTDLKNIIFFLIITLSALLLQPTIGYSKIKPLNLPNIQRISRSTFLILHEYYDPARIDPTHMLEKGLFEIAKEIPEFLPECHKQSCKIYLGPKSINVPTNDIKGLFDLLYPISLIFDFLHENYKGETSFEDMEYAFIAGMVNTLDPHSNILTPKIYKEFKTQTQGEYGGLGIVISIKEGELTVVSPMEGTPADKAGLKADDKIQQIDDHITMNLTLDEAADLMRGPPGTKVTLLIKSKNRDPRDVVVAREVINIESAQTKLLTYNNKNFGVVRLKGFQDNTFKETVSGLKAIQKKSKNNLSGIIMDLRNNAGGLLDQAILIADLFLSEGDIVYTVGADNAEEEKATARSQRADIDLPMIVLINEGSASAAEIVAGALKNNNRAIVMGQKSFGKGSVQSLFSLRDGSSLKLTVAQYLTPGRESIQAVGITPDIHLYPSIIDDEFYDLYEDLGYNETKLDSHLSNQKLVKKSRPLYNLTYLEKKTDDKDLSQYTSKIEEGDFAFKLALKILSNTKQETKKQMLTNISSLLKKEALEQEKLIEQKLKEKNIDWSLGLKPDKPQLSLTYQILDKSNKLVSEIEAGTEIKVSVTAKNTGSTTAHRVLTTIDAINPLLAHKEFVFGKLNPGQESTQSITVKIPIEIISFKENIKFLTYAQNLDDNPITGYSNTSFIETKKPRFVYSYEIFDGNLAQTTGNKNGIPEKGETVVLRFKLKNIGDVDSEKTMINIKNKEGNDIIVKKARNNLGLIKAQSESFGDLKFYISPNFNKDDLHLDFFAIDNNTKTTLTDNLEFNFTEPQSVKPKTGVFYSPPLITITKVVQSQGKLNLTANIVDNEELKDIAIFASGKKILYINVEKEQGIKEKSLSKAIELEDGLNSIVIRARDNKSLMGEESLSIVYDKGTS